MSAIHSIDALSEVIGGYDAIISDVWGVLHNGIVATPGAKEALAAARTSGRPVALLTNAPRPPDAIRSQLARMGIGPSSFDGIVSSGGVTRALMEKEGTAPFHHLGPARDTPLFEGLPARKAPLETADYVLCTGLLDDETETAETYRPMLEQAIRRDLRLYCANPDLLVERGDRLLPCAGAIADLYERMGGAVIWVGKPKPLVYAAARALIAEALGRDVTGARILCIGDAFRTDIAGANAEGHDSLMTLAGIHAHQIGLHGTRFDMAALDALATQSRARPAMCMVSLRW